MSEVRMSLQEYNQMKRELDLYKEIFQAVTTPCLDDWYVNYYKERKGSSMDIRTEDVLNSVSQESKKMLLKAIKENTESMLAEAGLLLEGILEIDSMSNIHFGSLRHPEEEKETSEE